MKILSVTLRFLLFLILSVVKFFWSVRNAGLDCFLENRYATIEDFEAMMKHVSCLVPQID